MSIKQTLNEIISKSSGSRLGEHAILPTKKAELFSEDARSFLRSQWDNAGRDAARIFVKLDEEDGSSIFLTGWDGENKFVGQSDAGFGYVDSKRITNAKIDEKWDNQLTLGHIRKNLDEMDRTQVSDLVSRLKKCLTKRSKNRRQSEVKNFVKRFQAACAADKAKEAAKAKAEVKTEAKNDDKKKPDKKGEYSWHTKGNRVVPMKEDFKSSLARFKDSRGA